MSSNIDTKSQSDVNDILEKIQLIGSNKSSDSKNKSDEIHRDREKSGENISTHSVSQAIKNADNQTEDSINEISNFPLSNKNMFMHYGRQLFCLLTVIITVYATYQNIPENNSHPPDVRPFFPPGSFVKDYPDGELFVVQNKVTLSDLSFCLFYAPWSADSQYARAPYDFVAKLFYKEATFSAINCWQPGGECKQQYAKVTAWPVLMAYNQNNVAIPYNGQWNEAALTRFVLSLIRPLERIHRPDDLLTMIHNHDAVVVAFVNMSTSASFYDIYMHAAIKWLERDIYRNIAFGVVTGDAITSFGVDREPSIRLYLWNDTIEYDNSLWKPSLLRKWIVKNAYQVSHWLSPPGTKSSEFRPFLEKGPVLVLFTPRNLYEVSNDAYAMLRQIGYEYFNCEHDEWLMEMARNYIYERRRENYADYYRMKSECDRRFDWRKTTVDSCTPFGKRAFVNLVNSSKFHYNSGNTNGPNRDDEYCTRNAAELIDNECLCESISKSFLSPLRSQTTHAPPNEPKISMLNNPNDVRSPQNIAKVWAAIQCKINNLSKLIRPKLFYDDYSEQSMNASRIHFDKINGLACTTNRTLTLLAMDSFTYELVAERLGITLKDTEQNTAAVIIDSENESAYVLKESITTSSLMNFIYEFTTNKLNRHLRNNANISQSHYFNDINNHNDEYYHPKLNENTQSFGKILHAVQLTEMSSENFVDYIIKSNKTVAVLFYSTQCAFCTIFSSTLLTCSRILKQLTNLEFIRIDSDKNDLPWEFTMDTLPSLIIFNADKKSESRKYPVSLPITVQNLLGFILSNLNRPGRLNAMVQIFQYNSHTTMTSIEHSLNVLRREIEENITYNLNVWRRMPTKRILVLRRIQTLKKFYLALYRFKGKHRDFNNLTQLVKNVLNVWSTDEI